VSNNDGGLPGFILGVEQTSGGIFVAHAINGEPILGQSQRRTPRERGVKVTAENYLQLQSFSEKGLVERVMNRLETVTEHLLDVEYAVAEGMASHYDIANAEGGAIHQDMTGTREQALVAGHCVFALTRLGSLPFDVAATARLGGAEGEALRESLKRPLERTNLVPPLLNGFVEKLMEDNGGVAAQVECVRRVLHEQPKGKAVNPLLLKDVLVKDVKPRLLEAVERSIQHVNRDLRPEVLAELEREDSFARSRAGWQTQLSRHEDSPVRKDPPATKGYVDPRFRVSNFPILARQLLEKQKDTISQCNPRMTLRSEIDGRLAHLAASRSL
jgi:hypothetical protein